MNMRLLGAVLLVTDSLGGAVLLVGGVLLGGAALQRCDRGIDLTGALAPEVAP
ncbi:MAG: hypothetical protein WA383_02745 [Terriglobales bacterium]|jgi:hypothetical protein